MNTNSRTCDAIGCKATVSAGKFMCLTHWRMVPVATASTINARYRACRLDFGFLSDMEYLQAAVDAVDAVAEREGKSGRNPYAGLLRVAQKKNSDRQAHGCPGQNMWISGTTAAICYGCARYGLEGPQIEPHAAIAPGSTVWHCPDRLTLYAAALGGAASS